MMVVSVGSGPEFSAGRPQVLFQGPFLSDFDVSADGERFVMVQTDQDSAANQIQVVLNWFEELKRLAPVN
jgi:hypothetical protein